MRNGRARRTQETGFRSVKECKDYLNVSWLKGKGGMVS